LSIKSVHVGETEEYWYCYKDCYVGDKKPDAADKSDAIIAGEAAGAAEDEARRSEVIEVFSDDATGVTLIHSS
jgi:hypothetical protein